MTLKNKIGFFFFLVMLLNIPSYGMNRLMETPLFHQRMYAPVSGLLTALETKRFFHKPLVTKIHPPQHHGQIYGIATYHALFKYVLSQKTVQSSFFRTFLPGIPVKSIERLDDHMNPLQSFQHLRTTFSGKDVKTLVDTLKKAKELSVHTKEEEKSKLTPHHDATKFLTQVVEHFDDFQNLIPSQEYDGTMDFVCELDNGDYALVEMQAVPQNHWDERALAYVAAFYGNQLRRGDKWHDLKKVIGINILGGGKDDLRHWGETPEQFIRHYKVMEQNHTPSRFIDGIEIIQYSLMNAPKTFDLDELKDWITFFRDGSTMSEEDVKREIKTQAVLDAFKFSKLTSLPLKVKEQYIEEERRYDKYSKHTAKEIEKGKLEGIKEGEARGELKAKMDMARSMLMDGLSVEMVVKHSRLTATQIDELRGTMADEKAKKKRTR